MRNPKKQKATKLQASSGNKQVFDQEIYLSSRYRELYNTMKEIQNVMAQHKITYLEALGIIQELGFIYFETAKQMREHAILTEQNKQLYL